MCRALSVVLAVVLASRTMNRYASMSAADRVRARERLCGIARDRARDAQRDPHAAGCNATLDVREPMLEDAARAWSTCYCRRPRVAARVLAPSPQHALPVRVAS